MNFDSYKLFIIDIYKFINYYALIPIIKKRRKVDSMIVQDTTNAEK